MIRTIKIPDEDFGERPPPRPTLSRYSTEPTKACATVDCRNRIDGSEIETGKWVFFVNHCDDCIEQIKETERRRKRELALDAAHERKLERWKHVWGGPDSGYHKTVADRLPHKLISERILSWTPRRGMLITGPTGSGKTRSVYLLLKKLLEQRIYAEIQPCVKLRQAIIKAAKSTHSGDRAELMRKLTNAHILYLDDFGQMVNTPAAIEAMYELLEERAKKGNVTIATSQFSETRLIEGFGPDNKEKGEAIARRLGENADLIEFPDFSLSP
jgi:DNA replication protein DnaC